MSDYEPNATLRRASQVFNDVLDTIPEPWRKLARQVASATWHQGRARGLIEAQNNQGSGMAWLVSAMGKESPYGPTDVQ